MTRQPLRSRKTLACIVITLLLHFCAGGCGAATAAAAQNQPASAQWRLVEGNLDVSFTPAAGFSAPGQARFILSTAGSNPRALDETKQGVIESPPFPVQQSYFTVIVGGGALYDAAYVSFVDADSGKELWRVTGKGNPALQAEFIDLGGALGRNARIRVVDRATSGTGYVLLGGVYPADQDAASDALVKEQINLLAFGHSRGPAIDWLNRSIKARHMAIVAEALGARRNVPLLTYCVDATARHPGPATLAPLRRLLLNADEQIARHAVLALGEHIACVTPRDKQQVQTDMARLMSTHASDLVCREAAGVIVKLAMPESNALLQQALAGAPPGGFNSYLQYLLASQGFTRTDTGTPRAGQPHQVWLRGFQCFVYVPRQWNASRQWPLLITVHGTWGSGLDYMALVQADCDRLGMVCIAPTFDTTRFWAYGHFNSVGGKWRPDLALIESVQAQGSILNLPKNGWFMFGHSEGAQFTSRFVLAHPDLVARAAMSGTDELPVLDEKVAFPLGLGRNPQMPDLVAFSPLGLVQVPSLLIVGTRDHKTILTLCHDWTKGINSLALARGHRGRLTYVTVNDGAHSGRQNWPRARQFLFGI